MAERGFADPAVAQKARDALIRLMIRTLNQERPPYQYGTVTQIDADIGSCLVLLPGDSGAVRVKFGAMRPARVGQVVRISGHMNDRFISDIIGGSVVADQPVDDLTAPTGVSMSPFYEAVTLRWNAMPGVSRYEAHFADNAAFTVNLRSFQTINNEITQGNLNPGSVVYGRVRALTSVNGTGPWSATVSATVLHAQRVRSDGTPPESSPQPVITSGIGYLLAEWLPVSNVDQVTYEVHVSTVSGFTPSASTKVGEVTGTFYFIRSVPGGGALSYGTTYFVRLIAKDPDGSAAAGAQGSGVPQQVEGSDVGRIPTSEIGDGNAPTSSPTPTVTNGIGYLYATWDHTVNADAVTYEVHLSTSTGFTPSSNTLIGTTNSNFIFIRKQGPGGSPANGNLVYGTTYFVKLIAKDVDGQAAAGGQGSGTPVQATTTDIGENAITTGHIQAGSITAASAIIADAAISTAKIQDAAITTAKIGDAQITTALIGDAQIITAKIADAAISTAKIGDAQITDAKIVNLTADKIISGTIAATVAITIASGGVVNSSNFVTGSTGFQINGDGSAEFNNVTVRGTITGSTITGSTITGSEFRTTDTGRRIVINNVPRINWHTGGTSETGPGHIYAVNVTTPTDYGLLMLAGPKWTDGLAPYMEMKSTQSDNTPAQVVLSANGTANLKITGSGNNLVTIGGAATTDVSAGKFFVSGDIAAMKAGYNSMGGSIDADWSNRGVSGGYCGIGYDSGWLQSHIVSVHEGSNWRRMKFWASEIAWCIGGIGAPRLRLDANGELHAQGAGSAYSFYDRTNGAGSRWAWYANGNQARLWSQQNGLDVLRVSDANLIVYNNLSANSIDVTNDVQCSFVQSNTSPYNGRLTTSNNQCFFDWFDGVFRSFVDVTQVKTFIIDHPEKPDHHLIHATLEGPENAVFYRGQARLVEGVAWIELPAYFEALTHVENRTVQLTPILNEPNRRMHRDMEGNPSNLPLAEACVPNLGASRVVNGRFKVMSIGGFSCHDAEFCWEVKAIRKDVPDLIIEPHKDEVDVQGKGPYRYYSLKK